MTPITKFTRLKDLLDQLERQTNTIRVMREALYCFANVNVDESDPNRRLINEDERFGTTICVYDIQRAREALKSNQGDKETGRE